MCPRRSSAQPTSSPNCKILENLMQLEREAGLFFQVHIFVFYFLHYGLVREHGNKFALTVLSEGLVYSYDEMVNLIYFNLRMFYLSRCSVDVTEFRIKV